MVEHVLLRTWRLPYQVQYKRQLQQLHPGCAGTEDAEGWSKSQGGYLAGVVADEIELERATRVAEGLEGGQRGEVRTKGVTKQQITGWRGRV